MCLEKYPTRLWARALLDWHYSAIPMRGTTWKKKLNSLCKQRGFGWLTQSKMLFAVWRRESVPLHQLPAVNSCWEWHSRASIYPTLLTGGSVQQLFIQAFTVNSRLYYGDKWTIRAVWLDVRHCQGPLRSVDLFFNDERRNFILGTFLLSYKMKTIPDLTSTSRLPGEKLSRTLTTSERRRRRRRRHFP